MDHSLRIKYNLKKYQSLIKDYDIREEQIMDFQLKFIQYKYMKDFNISRFVEKIYIEIYYDTIEHVSRYIYEHCYIWRNKDLTTTYIEYYHTLKQKFSDKINPFEIILNPIFMGCFYQCFPNLNVHIEKWSIDKDKQITKIPEKVMFLYWHMCIIDTYSHNRDDILKMSNPSGKYLPLISGLSLDIEKMITNTLDIKDLNIFLKTLTSLNTKFKRKIINYNDDY